MPDEPGATLTIDELVLRPWRTTDAPAVLVACQDPDIARWVAMPQPFLATDADAFVQDALAMWRDGTGAAFAVVDAVTGRLLGAVTRFGPDEHTSTFGCWVAPDARGRAIGRRALGLLADWTFATTETVRIDCYIMVGNDTSERMMQKLGWQREGVLRAWHVHPDGTPIDCAVYSLLRSDLLPAGSSVGRALSDLARQGLMRGDAGAVRNGIPLFPVRPGAGIVTLEVVNRLRDEAP